MIVRGFMVDHPKAADEIERSGAVAPGHSSKALDIVLTDEDWAHLKARCHRSGESLNIVIEDVVSTYCRRSKLI